MNHGPQPKTHDDRLKLDFEIIRGLPEHASTLTEITVAAKRHWNYPEHWIQLWLPTLTITPEYIATHETWIALLEEKPVAYYSFNENEDGLWLDNLWVMPEHIGKGIGKNLFTHALERCRARGASILLIQADPNAQSFYEKMGAYQAGEQHSEIDGQLRILPVMEIKL